MLPEEKEKIKVTFEGAFTKKLKERIERYIDKHLTGLTESEMIKLINEYTTARDFRISIITPTNLTVFLIK